jgi:hypothetical protein
MIKDLYSFFLAVMLFSGCETAVRLEPVKPTATNDVELLTGSEVFGSMDSAGHHHDHGQVNGDASSEADGLHRVRILETLQTKKYVYARVAEDNREYWLATNFKVLTTGDWYYYSGGYVMKDFPSREFKRVFSELMMVDNLVPENHGQQQKMVKP